MATSRALATGRGHEPERGVHIRGVVAQIYWSYYSAAALHGFTVRRDKRTGQWSLRATVVAHDLFRLKQQPLTLLVPTDKGNWCWSIDTFDIQQGTITAMLSNFKEIRP